MSKGYLSKELSTIGKNMKANLDALFSLPKIDIPAILDYFWMIIKAIVVVFGLITVIGIVQKPGKDASTVHTLQANHEEMMQDDLE